MEGKAYKIAALALGIAVVAGVLLAVNKSEGMDCRNGTYLIYSPSCPHCTHLKEEMERLNISYISVRDRRKAFLCLKSVGIDWDFSVPYLVVDGKVMKGYPSKSQDNNGYMISRQYEEKLCENLGWEKVLEHGEYVFCRKGNVYLGNRHALLAMGG